MKKLYMAVTADKYELPLIVGTAKEVAAYGGITTSGMSSMISNGRNGKVNKFKYVKITDCKGDIHENSSDK